MRLLALAAALAALLLYRRRRSRPREHVDLHFRDGSMVRLAGDSPEVHNLLGLGRDLLDAARR